MHRHEQQQSPVWLAPTIGMDGAEAAVTRLKVSKNKRIDPVAGIGSLKLKKNGAQKIASCPRFDAQPNVHLPKRRASLF